MGPADIPEDVLRFIERHIDSIPHLEALLLMWAQPAASWSAAELATRLYIEPGRAHGVLSDLARNGFIEPVAGPAGTVFHYVSAWDDAQVLPQVDAAYRNHLVYVTGLIHSKASRAVRDFARAFRFKDKE